MSGLVLAIGSHVDVNTVKDGEVSEGWNSERR